MKPFNQLTRRGRLRRLRQVVWKALEAYDLDIASLHFLTEETNLMFKVITVDGQKHVMRIYAAGESTMRENEAELFWLDRLHRDTNLPVIKPLPRRDGTYLNLVSIPGVPEDQRCALFDWVPGRELYHHLTPDNYFKLGQIMAQMHDHAESLRPLPEQIQPKKWDRVFYYADEPVVYNRPSHAMYYSPAQTDAMDRFISLANPILANLYATLGEPILIHADLNYWNVHVHRNGITVLDFEDMALGYPLQDVAICLWYGRKKEGYEVRKEALRHGYETIRPWPVDSEQQLQLLMTARTANFINYVGYAEDEVPQDYIDERCGEVFEYLANYVD